eukprot:CAMPEP_0170228404 /NCGR_PEP_ID=MMETSP0116_2-20130129/13920_1 /TAXON_ID=400756 /ORGANISM="Durinskia baltica, Strain CSIRO CS-38" /LENGTH=66 /DNA_ID=CAMNT_0010479143 /DNA_START=170 /DNA_END=370 /DNA_ORIENTATION=+
MSHMMPTKIPVMMLGVTMSGVPVPSAQANSLANGTGRCAAAKLATRAAKQLNNIAVAGFVRTIFGD